MNRSVMRPGEHLAEQIQGLGISAADLARQLHVPTNRVTEILKDIKPHHYWNFAPQFLLDLTAVTINDRFSVHRNPTVHRLFRHQGYYSRNWTISFQLPLGNGFQERKTLARVIADNMRLTLTHRNWSILVLINQSLHER
jgi:hypothetical protein